MRLALSLLSFVLVSWLIAAGVVGLTRLADLVQAEPAPVIRIVRTRTGCEL